MCVDNMLIMLDNIQKDTCIQTCFGYIAFSTLRSLAFTKGW